MLSKPATMLLGLISHQPLNAYEIVKTLDYMNIKYWFNIGTSTVYALAKYKRTVICPIKQSTQLQNKERLCY